VPSNDDILILSDDPQLQGELQSACSSLGERQPRLRFVSDQHALMEAIRSRPPALVLAPFGEVPREVSNLARELGSHAPPVPLVAIFRPYGFGDDVSESGVLIEALRAGVRDFLRRPISTTELRTLIDNLAGHAGTAWTSEKAPGCVVSFISNKGGVGKSTLAVNTAVGLALRHPGRVLLIDASLQMGVAAALLDLQPESTLTDAAQERDRLDGTMIRQLAIPHASGLHLLAAPADAIEAMEVDDTLIARIITLARRMYDFVIIDTFPMFDRVIVAALDLSDRAYIVMETWCPRCWAPSACWTSWNGSVFPAERQGLIVNRSQRIGGNLSLHDLEARLGRPIDHVLPFDKRVIAAANAGEPIGMRKLRFSGFSRGLQHLVLEIESLSKSPAINGTENRLSLGEGAVEDATIGDAENRTA
jgi:pilus assembly protein CpaE